MMPRLMLSHAELLRISDLTILGMVHNWQGKVHLVDDILLYPTSTTTHEDKDEDVSNRVID